MTAAEIICNWRENPLSFAYEELKFTPDKWQEEALRVFPSQDADKMRLSLQACTGPGKTAVMAIMVLNFMACYARKNEHPKGLCVSITQDNLRANLWPELANWQNRSEYLKRKFVWGKERFYNVDHPETYFMEARTWSKKADKEAQGRTLSGLHAPFVLVVMDEAGDIPVPILRSAEQIFSTSFEWAKILMGGNPTSLEGCLYHAASHARKHWYIIRVTGDPNDPMRSPRVNLANAKLQIETYGRDNPWIKATILGQFPDASINALLGIEDVQAAIDRVIEPHLYEWAEKRLGVDVARFGDDRSVIFPRQGLYCPPRPVPMRNADTVAIAARVAGAVAKWGGGHRSLVPIFIDDTGHWGHGVFDILNNGGYTAFPITYHAPATDHRFKNVTTEMAFRKADWVKKGGKLPNIPELVTELTARTYTILGGKLVLEDKGLVKARLGYSPDYDDALNNTFFLPDAPMEQYPGELGQSSVAKHDFDPNAG
jgi:hypothetical protein